MSTKMTPNATPSYSTINSDCEVGLGRSTNSTLFNDQPLGLNDVVCGRTSAAFNNIGNKRFRATIGIHLPRYINATTRNEKGVVIQSLVEIMTVDVGARFYKLGKKNGELIALEGKMLRQKVGHALRDAAVQKQFGNRKAPPTLMPPAPKRRSSISNLRPQRTLSMDSLSSTMTTQSAPETESSPLTNQQASFSDERARPRNSICNHLPIVDFWADDLSVEEDFVISKETLFPSRDDDLMIGDLWENQMFDSRTEQIDNGKTEALLGDHWPTMCNTTTDIDSLNSLLAFSFNRRSQSWDNTLAVKGEEGDYVARKA